MDDSIKTVSQLFVDVTNKYASSSRPVYLRKVNGMYEGVSYKDIRERVECFSTGLQALGVQSGERVGIVAENRVEFVISDFGITCIDCVGVAIFPTLVEKQLEYIFNDCGAVCVIVSNKFQLAKVLHIRDAVPTLKHIVVMQDIDTGGDPMVKTMTEVIQLGRGRYEASERMRRFLEVTQAVKEDDLCTIIYTSGTTGHPKGVMLTHKNLLSNVAAARRVVPLDDTDVFLSYLPMCHAYERIAGYYIAFAYGATTAFAESLETVRTNLKEVQPTIMTSVPRLFERIRNGVIANVEKAPPSKKKIFHWAISVGKQLLDEQNNGGAGILTRIQYALADKLVFSKIRELTGGRLRFFVSGGGALPADVNEFFRMLGMNILEGYGLTESSPVLTVTSLNDNEIGTVGKPLFNVEIKLAPDGEILARGPNIMRGYWNNPQATAETIDEQGWLHTGDIGTMTAKGNLKITDRKKNIFVNSGGKNIAPVPIENAALQSKFVEQLLLIGEKRDYCTALVVPNKELVETIAHAAGIDTSKGLLSYIHDNRVVAEVMRNINLHQTALAKYERIRKITLLAEPFTVENDMMTPTLKIKRKVVEKHYHNEIEAMYAGADDDTF
ncbi:MAG: long-chain fatty acid--CoA ligase [Candidatus Kapabacteria bacterium]|nr:long-chain fatty acid--CoA ligase [Candidatus Kapabacteria bacterium]